MISDSSPIAAPTQTLRQKLTFLLGLLSPQKLDNMVEVVAEQTKTSLVEHTPKRFFGQLRNGWKVQKPESQVRVIVNDRTAENGAPIMLFVEEGTANNGAGYIYPKQKKFLYIPLKASAVKWHAGLKAGVDYLLRLRVKGQKGQGVVAHERPRAELRLKDGYKGMIRHALDLAGVGRG